VEGEKVSHTKQKRVGGPGCPGGKPKRGEKKGKKPRGGAQIIGGWPEVPQVRGTDLPPEGEQKTNEEKRTQEKKGGGKAHQGTNERKKREGKSIPRDFSSA